jgi:hypothetical protein
MSKPFRILFFGSDAIALRSLQALRAAPDICAHLEIVAPPDQVRGRRHQVQPQFLKAAAAELDASIVVHQPPADCGFRLKGWNAPSSSLASASSSSSSSSSSQVPSSSSSGDDDFGFDVGVVVSFGYFLPQRLIERFPLGMVNVHPSLLPWVAHSTTKQLSASMYDIISRRISRRSFMQLCASSTTQHQPFPWRRANPAHVAERRRQSRRLHHWRASAGEQHATPLRLNALFVHI